MKMDMHVHTSHSEDCRTSIETVLKKAKNIGLDGIAITDHNEIGGALRAKKRSKGILVIVGEEIETNQGEILAYLVKKRIPPNRDISETIDMAKKQGCLVAVPHPFDGYRSNTVGDINILNRISSKIDFIEVNGHSFPGANKKAITFASKYGIPLIAGSDAHTPIEIGSAYTVFPEGKISKKTEVFYSTSTLGTLLKLIHAKIHKALRL
jgi:predicted metal-dependent phosphoesterase TrpH